MSQTADLSDSRRQNLSKEIAEFARLNRVDPQLTTKAFTSIANKSDLPANTIQNLIQNISQQANVSPAEVIPFLPRVLASGLEQGLTLPETLGTFTAGTRAIGSTESTATGIRNVTGILNELRKEQAQPVQRGKRPSRRQQLLSKVGDLSGLGFIDALESIRGSLDSTEITELFGRENFIFASAVGSQADRFRGDIGGFKRLAGRTDVDLVRDAQRKRFEEDPQAAVASKIRRTQVAIEREKLLDVEAQSVEAAALDRELKTRRASGNSEFITALDVWLERRFQGIVNLFGGESGFLNIQKEMLEELKKNNGKRDTTTGN